MERSDQLVRVLYNFEYSKDGRNIWMREGEALTLIKKTNPDWWQVTRANEKRPFYVPAAYVVELALEGNSKTDFTSHVVQTETKPLPPSRNKISEKKLFKEFPKHDTREPERCNERFSEEKSKVTDLVRPKTSQAGCKLDVDLEDECEGSRRLLDDKRRSWAAEELVSELTQMAIARSESVEADYANLKIDREHFDVVGDGRQEISVPDSFIWQSTGFVKEPRANTMSSSDELDNSDSLGQSNFVAWQSKCSLSSEGDKTDESIQSFHSIGNESVSSRHWRGEHVDDNGASPYAHVICTSSSIAPETSSLKLTDSLEKLAEQIKFPCKEICDDVGTLPPIAPPREYEVPVYENIEVQSKTEASEEMLKTLHDKLLQSSLSCIPWDVERITEYGETKGSDYEPVIVQRDNEHSRNEVDNDNNSIDKKSDGLNLDDCTDRASEVESKDIEEPLDRKESVSLCQRSDSSDRPLLEGIVDVKQKIALWNSSAVDSERQDRFDEDGQSRPRKVRPFRSLGVIKSASESRVSTLSSRHNIATPSESRSGSEEFLGGEDTAVGKRLNPEGDNLDASDSGLSNKSDEGVLDGRRRRTPLLRSRRVESARRYQRTATGPTGAPCASAPHRPQSPPPPSPGQEAARLLSAGWAEFRTTDARSFYYHAGTGQTRWKPPRRRLDSTRSASPSPLQDDADGEDVDAAPGPLPPGWRVVMDQSGQLCYVHPLHRGKWFSSSDIKGRVYFFEENSIESSWNLPTVISSTHQDSRPDDESIQQSQISVLPSVPSGDSKETVTKIEKNEKQDKMSARASKSRSMVIVDSGICKDSKNLPSSKNWPQLFDGDMYVLKEGPMCRTKITENGKKLRKNWAPCHVVLTELFLLLFRDAKSFAAMKSSTQGSTAPRPELSVDLNGALIDSVDRGDKAPVTSRKNVFLVSTVLGLQVLFQCDSSQEAEEWFNAVHAAIHNLPSGFDSCPHIKVTKEMDRLFTDSHSPEQTRKFPRIGRSKSVKIKNKDGSIEDLTVSVAERQTKIKARLKKFFNRRPTMESLVKKGIWKDEPAFGCYLEQVCVNESPRVPLFVQRCISVIESSEDNMKTDGLYRASGNLSQVQKIRLQIDQNNWSALDQEEDVHVLTGALKLFFRELKEPLIPYIAFNKAIKASTLQSRKEKLAQFKEIVKSLPPVNHDTLKMLLKHLLKVTGYQEFNRMHIPNLAIVFGPTLMWPEQESLNMALDLMQQNLVIEAFLLDFDSIFC